MKLKRLFDRMGLAPQTPATASRAHVPVYKGRDQMGKATSTTWSPLLKQLIALASLEPQHATLGARLQMEITVEAVRHRVSATVRSLPFFNPHAKPKHPCNRSPDVFKSLQTKCRGFHDCKD